jgi:hypothetical protein
LEGNGNIRERDARIRKRMRKLRAGKGILTVMKGKWNIGVKRQGTGMEEVEGKWKYRRGGCKDQEKGRKLRAGKYILTVMKGKGNIRGKRPVIGMEEVEGEWKYWIGGCRVEEKEEKIGRRERKRYFGRVIRGEKYWRKAGQGKGKEEVEGEWKYWRRGCRVEEKEEKMRRRERKRYFGRVVRGEK